MLPFDDSGAPGEPCAEDDHQDEIAAMNAARFDGLVQGNGDRGGGGVAVFVEIDKELLGFGAKAFADGVDDAAIGLVWDNAFDAGNINFAAAHGFPGGGEQDRKSVV